MGCRHNYLPAIWAFKLRKLMVASTPLQNCQLIRAVPGHMELGEAVPNAANSGTDLNLESSSTSFYPDENHYPLVYF